MPSIYIILPLILLLYISCASIQYPEGGNKDTTPPKIIKTSPTLPTYNFKKNALKIYFNEYIKNEDYSKEVLFSPLQAKPPKVLNYAKKIKIVFQEPLQDTLTYILTIGKNIKDFNEGNHLNTYIQYPISRSSTFDTCKIQTIINIGHPLLKISQMYIAIYPTDSIFSADDYYHKSPLYLFPIENDSIELNYIHPNYYKIIAFQDHNNDRKFQKNENIAINADNRINLLNKQLQHINLVLFPVDDTPVKIKKLTWKDSLTVDIETNEPIIKDSLIITTKDFPLLYKVDESKNQLITLYFNQPIKDSTFIKLIHLTDTLGNKTDTILKLIPQKIKSKREPLVINSPKIYPTFWKISANFPLDSSAFPYFTIKDSSQKIISLPYRIQENSLIVDVLQDHIDTAMHYTIIIDSNLTAFQGQKPDSTIIFSFKPSDYNKLCKLSLNINSNYKDFIGVLKHKESKNFIYFDKDETEFEELQEGNYELVIIDDTNHNNRWDTGKLVPFQYPERLYIHPTLISLKSSLHTTLQVDVPDSDF